MNEAALEQQFRQIHALLRRRSWSTFTWMLEGLAEQAPRDERVYYLSATYCRHHRHYRQAEQYFKDFSQLAPYESPYWAACADFYTQIGRYDEAIELELRHALNEPGDLDRLLRLSRLYFCTGKYGYAKELAERFLRDFPDCTGRLTEARTEEEKLEARALIQLADTKERKLDGITYNYYESKVFVPITARHYENECCYSRGTQPTAMRMLVSWLREQGMQQLHWFEIGSGTGFFASLALRYHQAKSVTALDPRPPAKRALDLIKRCYGAGTPLNLDRLDEVPANGQVRVSWFEEGDLDIPVWQDPQGVQTTTLDAAPPASCDLLINHFSSLILPFLEGAAQTLQKLRPLCFLLVEYSELEAVTERMAALGYKLEHGDYLDHDWRLWCHFKPV